MEEEYLINLLLGEQLSDAQLDDLLKKGMGQGEVHPEKNYKHHNWGVIEEFFAPTYITLSDVLFYVIIGGISAIILLILFVVWQKDKNPSIIFVFGIFLVTFYCFTKEERKKYALMRKWQKALETQNANALREKWETRYESIHGEKPKFWKNLENESDAFLARFFWFLL